MEFSKKLIRSVRATPGEAKEEDAEADMLFAAALGELFTNNENFEETSRRFLNTNHEYVPYIAMMLAARMSQNNQSSEEAQSVLRERLPKPENAHWNERLRQGDETAWREMLIAYYLKQISRDQIFEELEDDKRYAHSDLRFVLSRQGGLCEAYFYDALLAQTEQDRHREEADLQRVLQTGEKGYIEYNLAKYLVHKDADSHR